MYRTNGYGGSSATNEANGPTPSLTCTNTFTTSFCNLHSPGDGKYYLIHKCTYHLLSSFFLRLFLFLHDLFGFPLHPQQTHEYNIHPLFHRRTRHRCTSRLAWGKQTSSSCFCSTWPIRTPPPPTATPPSTSPLGRGRWRRRLCCWRLEPHTHWPPRYQNPNPLFIQTLVHQGNITPSHC